MDFKDYYKIMGVERDAGADDIKRAYRKLARKYHPDVSTEEDAEQRFKEIGEAYAVLRDPEKRAAYDQLGADWKAGQDFRPPPDWDAGFEFSGAHFGAAGMSGYSDFFESLFGGAFRARPGGRQRGRFDARGEDHHAKIAVDLEDAYRGATREITLRAPELDSSGHVATRQRSLKVRIPKGVRQGQRIRLSGQGSPGIGDGPAGDLYLEVEFRSHDRFRVEGRDVYVDVPVAPWEAALGATITVPVPDGSVDMKVPAGTTRSRTLRLRGKGIPGSPPGDLYAVLQITLPPADTDEARALYEQMRRDLPYEPRKVRGV